MRNDLTFHVLRMTSVQTKDAPHFLSCGAPRKLYVQNSLTAGKLAPIPMKMGTQIAQMLRNADLRRSSF